MTKDEALKLALEALENLFGIPDKWTGEGGGDVAVWRLGGSYRAQQAITAIKEALAQPEQEPAIGDIRALKHRIHELEGEVIGYKQILDAEQEPVAYAKNLIEGLYENGDPVSVDAAELLEKLIKE